MFTGIIRHIGVLQKKEESTSGISLFVELEDISESSLGDSVAVNGACLTVTYIDGNILEFDVINETLSRTNLGDLNLGDELNIEFSMKLNDLVGGHLVSGHVDFVSTLNEVDDNRYSFALDSEYSNYFVPKGSVSINGVSLTITDVGDDYFSVDLIPESIRSTNFRNLKPGSQVNIEIDLIARYLAKLV